MNKLLKWGLIVVIGIVVALIVTYYTGRNYFKTEVEKEITLLCEKSNIIYDNLKIDLVNNHILIISPRLDMKKYDGEEKNLKWAISNIKLSGFNYIDYLKNKNIRFDSMAVNNPRISYFKDDISNFKNFQPKWKFNSNSVVYIEKVLVKDASLDIFSSDSLISSFSELDLNVSDVMINDSLSVAPLSYKNIGLNAKNVSYVLGEYEQLFISEVQTDFKKIKLKDISVKTKYNRQEYDNKVEKERDWYNAIIDSISIADVQLIELDSSLLYKIHKVELHNPTIQIYRNKLLPDDYDYKPLYSKTLRELNKSFQIDTTFINNASITYKEKVAYSSNEAELTFSELTGTLLNFGNHFDVENNTKTLIALEGKFMGTTNLDVQWEYKVSDENDAFIFMANIESIDASRFNPFIQPNINAVLSGVLKKTYFTISGTDYSSNIDMKLSYDHFKVTVFKKNSREKNKLLSSLANLFIKKTTEREQDNFRETTKHSIKRDTNKSFFSFVWLNVREGLILAMVGDAGQK